uniref:AXH domain-containing protein n=1 Tax=Soboliphyme baturini TaxID=241478 RepID=A0A183JAL0_9BILA
LFLGSFWHELSGSSLGDVLFRVVRNSSPLALPFAVVVKFPSLITFHARMYPASVYSQFESRNFLLREFGSDPRLMPAAAAAAAARFSFMNPPVVGGAGVHLSSTLTPFHSLGHVTAAAAANGTNTSLINAAYFYSHLSAPSGYDGRGPAVIPYFDDRYSGSYFPADSSAFVPPPPHRQFNVLQPLSSSSLDYSDVVVGGSRGGHCGSVVAVAATTDAAGRKQEHKMDVVLEIDGERERDARMLSFSGVDSVKNRTISVGHGKGDSSPEYVSSINCEGNETSATKSDPNDDDPLEVDIADKNVDPSDDVVHATSSCASLTSFANCFVKGTSVLLANGKVKHVEDLVAEDFMKSGFASQQLCVKNCSLLKITQRTQGRVLLHLLIDGLSSQVIFATFY